MALIGVLIENLTKDRLKNIGSVAQMRDAINWLIDAKNNKKDSPDSRFGSPAIKRVQEYIRGVTSHEPV